MSTNEDYKLDNPVWYSLSETHRDFSIDYNGIKFYHPDYCPFGGFASNDGIPSHIAEYSKLVDNFFVVGEMPELSNGLDLKKELVCLQMVIEDKILLESRDVITVLGNEHRDELFQLVTAVQPGYFRMKTALLGNYYGVFNDGKLVSVTGERMKMDGFIELSAIVTHPDHVGKGYAKQLISYAVNNIFTEGKTAFLHVAETNTGAIRLYEKSGFRIRRKMSFWNITT